MCSIYMHAYRYLTVQLGQQETPSFDPDFNVFKFSSRKDTMKPWHPVWINTPLSIPWRINSVMKTCIKVPFIP